MVVLKKLSGPGPDWWAWEVSIDGVPVLVDFKTSAENLARHLTRNPEFCREMLLRKLAQEVHET